MHNIYTRYLDLIVHEILEPTYDDIINSQMSLEVVITLVSATDTQNPLCLSMLNQFKLTDL